MIIMQSILRVQRVTPAQAAWIGRHVKFCERDGDRARVRYLDGRTSEWFSLSATILWKHIRPAPFRRCNKVHRRRISRL